MFGLPEKTLNQIITCLAEFPQLQWVKIYGSRAMGTDKKASDINLAFSCPVDISAKLLSCLDELPTPYLFDVTHYESITHEGLKAHIDEYGKDLFCKP